MPGPSLDAPFPARSSRSESPRSESSRSEWPRSVVHPALPLSAIVCAICAACSGLGGAPRLDIDVPEGPVPWTGVEPLEEPDDFRFVVVTDRTGEHRPGIFESAMPKVDLLKPAFVMSVGDLIEGYSDDRAQLTREWDEFEGFIERLSMPFFYLPGNHDMSNRVMGEVWRERFGPTFYHFRYKNVLFLALNSELFRMVGRKGPVPGVESQAEQMAFVEEVLEANRDARWTMVFVHQPLWDPAGGPIHPDWLRVEELLGERPYTVFAGHYHAYTKERRNDRNFITLGTTGGGSPLRGPIFGEFDHVAMVTMKREGPVLANLLLDGIHDIDVRTKAMRTTAKQLERAVRLVPGRVRGERFWKGDVELEFSNGGETPLTVEGVLEDSPSLRVTSERRIERTLAPGARERVVVALRAKQSSRGAAFSDLDPVRAHWRLEQSADGKAMEIERETLVFPGNTFSVTSQRRAVTVDGDLREWGALRFDASRPWHVEHEEHHEGPSDASFRFDVRQANDALYLAFDVTDDSLVLSEEKIAREQDSLAVSVDARPDPERSSVGSGYFAAIADGTFQKLIVIDALPVSAAVDSVMGKFVPRVPESVRVASLRTRGGYAAEIEIPFLELEHRAGGPWEGVRLEISLRDFDHGDDDHHSLLWWRPSRFGKRAVEGTATFLRESGGAAGGIGGHHH